MRQRPLAVGYEGLLEENVMGRSVPLNSEDVSEQPAQSNVLVFFLFGLHFGIVQTALFFALLVFITASYMGYFVIVVAWMIGVILGLRFELFKTLTAALVLGIGAYFSLLLLGSITPPHGFCWPIYFLLAIASALPAGAFFRRYSSRVASCSLFFHENNGFVLGLLFCVLGFVKWGVPFLFAAPVVSLAITLVGLFGAGFAAFLSFPVIAVACFAFDNTAGFWEMLFISIVGLSALFVSPRSATKHAGQDDQNPRSERGKKRDGFGRLGVRVLLAAAGANLILLQFFITREFSSVLAATELTILIVSAAYFAGFSVGYGVSNLASTRLLRVGVVGAFGLHLFILLFAKVAAGYVIDAGYGTTALVALLFLASFCAASVFSVFLPKLIDDSSELSLVSGYSWDLFGAICGIVALFVFTIYAPQCLWPTYFALLLLVVVLVHGKSRCWPSLSVVGLWTVVIVAIFQGQIQTFATEDYYRTRGYDYPNVVFQGNSLYHTVEVLDTFVDREQTQLDVRVAFINGVRYFRFYYQDDDLVEESNLSEFSYFLAGLPAHYLSRATERRLRVLVMGAGSMYTVSRVAPYAYSTTVVEIDPLVVQSAQTAWSGVTGVDQIDNYEIVLDDIQHYLRTTEERFDLIVNDISAPYYIGTALLHGREFYQLVASHLTPDGLFAEATQGRPNPNRHESTAMKIIRGVADVFPRFRVVVTERGFRLGDQGYVYATHGFDLTTDGLTEVMRADGMYAGTRTFWERSEHFSIFRTEPFSRNNMETLLTRNFGRVTSRLGIGEDDTNDRLDLAEMVNHVFDRNHPLHSRLVVKLHHIVVRPFVWGSLLGSVLLAILLYWLNIANRLRVRWHARDADR